MLCCFAYTWIFFSFFCVYYVLELRLLIFESGHSADVGLIGGTKLSCRLAGLRREPRRDSPEHLGISQKVALLPLFLLDVEDGFDQVDSLLADGVSFCGAAD